jgi:polar amino acid transport system substrate-binding protein
VKALYSIIALSGPLLLSGCFQSKKDATQDHILIVGTESNFPNFSFKDGGELVGFDIDVVTEVAKRIGKTIEFRDMNFEALLPQVQLGAIQVIAAGMTPTPERAKIVSFTEPYIIGDPLLIVTLADSDTKDLEDLKKGKRVVVNQGYTADFYMSKIEGPELIRLETPAEAFLSLQQGRADAYVTAKNTLAPFFKKRDAEGFERKIIPGTDESTALIVSKKYPELLREIQGALHQMERDGTMTTLKKKWDINA